jgi:hypothetical protein
MQEGDTPNEAGKSWCEPCGKDRVAINQAYRIYFMAKIHGLPCIRPSPFLCRAAFLAQLWQIEAELLKQGRVS